jgi:hypothetical protein
MGRAVVSGQTWHWVDPLAGAAKAAEALRPGGRLAAFWNADRLSPEVAEASGAVYRRLLPGSLAAGQWSASGEARYAALSRRAAEGILASGAFDEPEAGHFDWERDDTREEWLDQLPTNGGHPRLPAAQLERVSAGVAEAVDAMGGAFAMRCTAVAVTAIRAPGHGRPRELRVCQDTGGSQSKVTVTGAWSLQRSGCVSARSTTPEVARAARPGVVTT